jgi:GTP pyrophosphokinase
MIKIKEQFPRDENGQLDLEKWLQHIQQTYSPNNINLLRHSSELASTASKGLTTFYGQPCLEQGIEIAEIMLELKLDSEAIAAAIVLSTAHQAHLSHDAISKQLGESVWKLVDSVLHMDVIQSITASSRNQMQIDRLRKTLLAMVSDIRAVLIKLAERTVLMRGIKHINSNERKRFAQETMDIYAPLANRLGIGQLKWELEDLAFHYLNPETYKTIASFLSEKRGDRETRIKQIIKNLQDSLMQARITAKVIGRAKHIYSIYMKKQHKQIDYKNIFDYSAVRILVTTVEECYTALSIVHHLWEHIPTEFDDYIANPKPNGYQSIHTAVIGPDGKNLEVQIRTYAMNEQSEHGVAAHWLYKEKDKSHSDYQEKITYLRQLLAWQGDINKENQPKTVTEIFSDRVYVFTPQGDIIDLPVGATPLDFAYHIHSELGHRCRGAKANGQIIHLTHPLRTGDRVDILTVPQGNPSRDWLNPELGYLKTARGRSKVAQWFRQQEVHQYLDEGKYLLEKEFTRLNIRNVNLHKIATQFNFKNEEAFFTALGQGHIRASQVINAIHADQKQTNDNDTLLPLKKTTSPEAGLQIAGVNDLLTRIARCCKPIPGDTIIGFITQGRGVSIHRKNCNNIANPDYQNRLINVSWDSDHPGSYYADVYIRAYAKDQILKEITNLLTNLKINLVSLNTTANQKNQVVHINMTVQIHSSGQLKQLMTQFHELRNIIETRRVIH